MEKVLLLSHSKEELVDIILDLDKENKALKEEIARLKKLPKKPEIKPNRLEEQAEKSERPTTRNKKSKQLKPTETITLQPKDIPAGSIFKGYQTYYVQELITGIRIIEYKRARYETPDGEIIVASLPAEIRGYHFGPEIRRHIIYQNQVNRVPQEKIQQELSQRGIHISEGEIDRILADAVQDFKAEEEKMVETGINTAQYLQVDDTGARHAGTNGICTFVGNDFFSFYRTTNSKSRTNFVSILQGINSTYVLNHSAFEYIKKYKMPQFVLTILENNKNKVLSDANAWEAFLQDNKITPLKMGKDRIKHLTIAAKIGGLVHKGFDPNTVILSDGAGQFDDLGLHARCWIHAMRLFDELVPHNKQERLELDATWKLIKDYYQELKAYQAEPTVELKQILLDTFDQIFAKQQLTFNKLNDTLISLYRKKDDLLRVLDHPFVPLHNNGSEREIREFVTKRKISGGTRSNTGRQLRDVFTGLSKTCRKLDVSFWNFLGDRISKKNLMPQLSVVLQEKVTFNRHSSSP